MGVFSNVFGRQRRCLLSVNQCSSTGCELAQPVQWQGQVRAAQCVEMLDYLLFLSRHRSVQMADVFSKKALEL